MSIGGATGLNDLHTGLPNNNTGLAEAGMGHNQHHSAHMGTGMAAGMGSAMAHPSSGVGSGMGQEHSLSSNALGPGTGYDHSHTYGGVGSGMGPPQSGSTDNNMNQGGSGFGSNGGTIGTGMAHTHASSGMGQHHHSDYQPQGTDAGTASGTGFDASKSGRHGKGIKVSSATKGAEYDATGGAVDDRTAMQKVKDKLTPGSDIGKHTKA